jgi:hypothetical protein
MELPAQAAALGELGDRAPRLRVLIAVEQRACELEVERARLVELRNGKPWELPLKAERPALVASGAQAVAAASAASRLGVSERSFFV